MCESATASVAAHVASPYSQARFAAKDAAWNCSSAGIRTASAAAVCIARGLDTKRAASDAVAPSDCVSPVLSINR